MIEMHFTYYAAFIAWIVDGILAFFLFSISPNPATDYINIVSSETVSGVLITISDVNGKTLYAIKRNFIKGQSLRIATLGFSSGTLFVTVNAGTDRSRFKIIKQ